MNNPLRSGAQSLSASTWTVALPGTRRRSPTPATCQSQKYPWLEGPSLPKHIHPVSWQMGHRKGPVHLWEFWLHAFPAQRQTLVGRCTFCLSSQWAGSSHGVGVCWRVTPAGQSGSGGAQGPRVTGRLAQVMEGCALPSVGSAQGGLPASIHGPP